MRRTLPLALALLAVVGAAPLAAGCDRSEKGGAPKADDKGGATPAGSVSSSAGAAGEPAAKAKPQITAARAEALVKAWVKAQNDGAFDAYLAFYDATFKGIRRSDSGAEKTMDLAGWKADRAKMFKKKQTVAADEVKVVVEGELAKVSFTQRWKSPSYADHGEKALELRNDAAGELRIVREELKWSETGWEDSKGPVFDATALAAPVAVRVEIQRTPKIEASDCQSSKMVIHLQGASGSEQTFEHGLITGMGEGNDVKVGFLKPAKGELSELGQWCAGMQQGYVVKLAGDTLVAIETWKDEETGGSRAAKVIAKLPAGGKATLK